MRRLIMALLAAAALIFALPGTASAHTTDDWYNSSTSPNSSFGWTGQSGSVVGGVHQWANMWSDGGYAAMSFGVEDQRTDGYCATLQISYEIYDGGWVGHRHTRNTGLVDCSTNGDFEFKQFVYSNYMVRSMASRACHASSSGAIVQCEGTWHYV
ncbi:hypothetical protein [Streptomyces sp. enrichment culture]|uniref:hypothetical protein n=1 Tax=Streptomyces sp. enrichment culture TaxID=1795815 RepID=UPI003F562589